MKTQDRIGRLREIAQDCPATWFFILESAKEDGDPLLTQQALLELERLGVRVTYVGPDEELAVHVSPVEPEESPDSSSPSMGPAEPGRRYP